MSPEEKTPEQLPAINKSPDDQKKIPGPDKKLEEATEKFEKTKTLVQVTVSVLAFLLSIFSILNSGWTNNNAVRRQHETQAHNYWQNFLQLAVQKPVMANGDDSNYYDTIQHNKAKKIEYAWFVANALGAAEIVFRLQKNDEEWRNTLKQIISHHSKYINSPDFNTSFYSGDFYQLIQEATKRPK